MKIGNLVFNGAMASILMIGGAYAVDTPNLATEGFVRGGVNYAIEHATDKVSVDSTMTKTAGANGAYTLSVKTATAVADGDAGFVTGDQVAEAIETVTGGSSTLATDVNSLKTTVGTQGDGDEVESTGLIKDIEDLQEMEGRVIEFIGDNSIESIDGTLTGAMNTLQGADTVSGSVANTVKTGAAGATYNNATSGLAATTINGAIDEVEGRVDVLEGGVNTEGSVANTVYSSAESGAFTNTGTGIAASTIAGAIKELKTSVDAAGISNLKGVNGVSVAAGTGADAGKTVVSAAVATNSGVVAGADGLALDGTGSGVMYNNGVTWERLSITSDTFTVPVD